MESMKLPWKGVEREEEREGRRERERRRRREREGGIVEWREKVRDKAKREIGLKNSFYGKNSEYFPKNSE